MKIYLATDHAGFDIKEKVKAYLMKENFDVEDLGALVFDKDDDYPDFIAKAAQAVSQNSQDRAIIFGGSGQGESMLANKYPHVRSALFYGPGIPQTAVDIQGRKSEDPFEIVRLMREHNDANILSLATRFVTEEEAMQAVIMFLKTVFSENPRHKRRLDKMESITSGLYI